MKELTHFCLSMLMPFLRSTARYVHETFEFYEELLGIRYPYSFCKTVYADELFVTFSKFIHLIFILRFSGIAVLPAAINDRQYEKVGASILKEMEKEDASKDISNIYFEFFQICHAFCVIRSIYFTRRSYSAVNLHNSVWSRRRTTSAFYSSPESRSLCRSCYCWITNIRVFAGMLF
jgi:hypothetical protein